MPTLTDAGPLIALIDKGDRSHVKSLQALRGISGPLITTWPCLTEAMHLLYNVGGQIAQDGLWTYVDRDLVQIHEGTRAEQIRMRALMAKYRDVPMDLADASIIAAAEVLRIRQVFTLDSDFYIYVIADGSSLEVIP